MHISKLMTLIVVASVGVVSTTAQAAATEKLEMPLLCPNRCLSPYPPMKPIICGKNKNRVIKAFQSRCQLDLYSCDHPDDMYLRTNPANCKGPIPEPYRVRP
ncbi:hypothetical protein BGX23_009494 [Mortierella sp. AD031]|nr:hypothetical protein BGX23_009494 [Mortierella sp. AD031]KAG0201517.1 hypothetical protein BGX33_010268 [Mortierella sp. NVP41]